MKISSSMKRDVVSIHQNATLAQAADLIISRKIGTLPVVDDQGTLTGLLQLRDLLALVMPDFVRLVEDFDYVHDFGALETRKPSKETLARRISTVMHPPISVEENCGALRAYAVLQAHRMLDLPVVDSENRLVGILSRVDIGAGLLASWPKTIEGNSE